MARTLTDAYSIFQSDRETEDKLREVIGSIQDMIQANLVSKYLRNENLSGDPMAGSVNVKRLMTSTVRDYGTARGNGFGDKVADNGVTINLDQRKEVVEEINKFDIAQYGLADMLSRRAMNIALSVDYELDTKFFAEAESKGTEVTFEGTAIQDKVEELIQKAETTSNDNVRGVNRSMLALSLSPKAFGALENYIDTLPNPVAGGVDVNYFHRVKVYANPNQTEDAICMLVGAIAQPAVIADIKEEDIPLSNEVAIQVFFNYGVEAVTPDLIYYGSLFEEEVSA